MSLDSFLLAMAAPQAGANPLVSFIPLIAMLAIFYFILVLPMKKKQQKVQAFLQALKEGDRVVTSGYYRLEPGSIVDLPKNSEKGDQKQSTRTTVSGRDTKSRPAEVE